MNIIRTLLAAALVLSSAAASAQFVTGATGSLGTGTSFLALSRSNVTGGEAYDQSKTFGHMQRPVNIVNGTTTVSTVGNWAVAGGSTGSNLATLTLAPGTTGVSFLWGTPDHVNTLKINTRLGSQSFSASQFFQSSELSKLDVAGYVNFKVLNPANSITSIEFGTPWGAFELANVSAVPEPGTYAMMLAGLALVAGVARRKRSLQG